LRLFLAWHFAVLALLFFLCGARAYSHTRNDGAAGMKKGYDTKETGLVPVYPSEYACSPLTSLYASWLDIDGTHREEVHTGVDGGRLGEWILAPAPGKVRAVWEADWRWGREGALVLVHTAADLNMKNGAALYYSVYDHLKYSEIKHLEVGQSVQRGEPLARVYRPGGKAEFLPEVHWEAWEAEHDELEWVVNRYGGHEWRNDSARLIDPLYLLGVHSPPADSRSVRIVPFEKKGDYSAFRGFTYIFKCRRKG
jgi:murein DD-endopeptidase MepM/ murein hydrolase activator NlpD